MKLRRIYIAIMAGPALLTAAADGALASPPAQTCSAYELRSHLADANRRMAADPLVAGASSAIILADGSVVADAAGFADIENATPLRSDHLIPIGSISKVLTTAALGRMVDRRAIAFQGSINPYVSQLPQGAPEISFAQLASHTAGVRHYVASDRFFGPQVSSDEAHLRYYQSVADVLPIFINDDLLFEPGEGYSYSSFGYALLSAAMESAYGQPYLELMRREVTEPLRLTDTIENDRRQIIPRRARGYAALADTLVNAPAHDASYVWAGGGYLSTPSDLVRFAQAHLDPAFLSPATFSAMITRQPIEGQAASINGIGWELVFDDIRSGYADDPAAAEYAVAFRSLLDRLGPIAFHSGSTVGGHGLLALDIKSGVAVAYLSNSNGPEIDAAAIRMTYDVLSALEIARISSDNCPTPKDH